MPFYPFGTSQALKADALRLAGEPQDGSSPYDDLVYDWMTSIQSTLVSGGMIGPSPLVPIDWLWARKYPRGSLVMPLPFNGDASRTATFTQGSDVVTFTGTPFAATESVVNWRMWVQANTAVTRPYIVQMLSGNSFQLKDPWSDITQTTANWLAFQAEFDLPADFLRFSSPLYTSGWPYRIDVVEPYEMEKAYPFSLITAALPVLAAMVATQKLRFSHFIGQIANGAGANTPLLVEFEYIMRPDPITDGTLPIVPQEHARVLSYGAAYQISDDKADNDRDRMYVRFAQQYKAMLDEHRANLYKGSSRWGTVIPRTIDEPRRLRTESGLIVW